MSKDMIKDTDEYPDGRDAQGKVSGEGRRAPMSSPGTPIWSPTRKLSEPPYFGDFMEAGMIHH